MTVSIWVAIGITVIAVCLLKAVFVAHDRNEELRQDLSHSGDERRRIQRAHEELQVEFRRVKKILEAHHLYVPKVGEEVMLEDLGYDELKHGMLMVKVEKITDDDAISVVITQHYPGSFNSRVLERRWIKLNDIRYTRAKVLEDRRWG